jgi:pantothenate kinase
MTDPPILANPVEQLRKMATGNETRYIVALAGLPGSGKTTLAAQLANRINTEFGHATMAALSMDGFHIPKSELRKMPDPDGVLKRRGAPWTFDALSLANRLSLVRECAGKVAVLWPDFQHGTGDPVPDVLSVMPSVKIVLVEGLYLLYNSDGWDAVTKQFAEKWYLDTPVDIAIERLTQRHMASRHLDRATAEHRIAENDKLNADLTMATRGGADWLVQ